ncbi:hypothetical protein AB836_01420 [Rickettsiales bacterium (ex Bugula neritina AB1)]|nr:hypothetical protein AB836_01420 [Rickettsiales bacterium (ex Bugula neritina AB1)]
MQFQVITKLLLQEVSYISKVTNSKSPILIHASINMKVENNNLILQATDMDHHIMSKIDVQESLEGSVIVKIKDFLELLKKINYHTIKLSVINNTLEIKDAFEKESKSNFNFFILKEDFPSLDITNFKKIFSISQKQFLELFSFMSITQEEWTFNLKLSNNLLEIIASDKKRLIYTKLPINEENNYNYFLSHKSINIILKSACDTIEMYEKNHQILFKLGHVYLFVKLLKNHLVMDYQRILGKIDEGTKILINTNDFLRILNRIIILASVISQVVKITFQGNTLLLQSSDISKGKGEESIQVISGVCEGKIFINCNFLISSIKTLKNKELELIYTGNLSHFFLRNNDIIHVIMPIRIM